MARRTKRNGRSKGEGQYFALPYSMARHEAFRKLSGAAVKVFIELRCRFTVRGDGSNNNGELTLSLDEAARLLGLGKATVQRALEELEAAGFAEKVVQGHWYGRKASQWRVTDQPFRDQPPSRDWQKPKAENQNSVLKRSMFNPDGTIRKPKG